MKLDLVFLLLGIALASAASAAAPPVKPNPAAVDAVAQVFLGPEPDRARNLAKRRQALEVGSLRAPREERIANVLLSRGLTGAGVQALLAPRHMELVSFEAKVPLPGPPNHMMTLWLGTQALPYHSDSLEELVDMAIGHERFKFLQRAQKMGANPEVRGSVAEYRAVAMSHEFAAYRLEVVGTREALFSLLRSPVVYAVLVNEDAAAVAAFRREKAELESRVIFRGPRIPMGPIDPDKPLPEMPSFPPVDGETAEAMSTWPPLDPAPPAAEAGQR